MILLWETIWDFILIPRAFLGLCLLGSGLQCVAEAQDSQHIIFPWPWWLVPKWHMTQSWAMRFSEILVRRPGSGLGALPAWAPDWGSLLMMWMESQFEHGDHIWMRAESSWAERRQGQSWCYPLSPEPSCPEGTIVLVFLGVWANKFPFGLSKSGLSFLPLLPGVLTHLQQCFTHTQHLAEYLVCRGNSVYMYCINSHSAKQVFIEHFWNKVQAYLTFLCFTGVTFFINWRQAPPPAKKISTCFIVLLVLL